MEYTYRREADRTILQIEDGKGPEGGSYPVRMLCGGIIPGMLKCQLRNMDGNCMLCFDVTSLQTLRITCEEKKLNHTGLRMILENCIGMAERMEDYLMPPGQLLMDPDHIFVSPEKDRLFFAAMPGRKTDIRQQLTETMEYLLSVIDHSDREAMTAGYGFYRAVLDAAVPLSGLRKAVYKEQWSMEDALAENLEEEAVRELKESREKREDVLWNEDFVRDGYRKEDTSGASEEAKKRKAWILILPAAAFLLFAVIVFLFLSGRTGAFPMDGLLLMLAFLMALGVLFARFVFPKLSKAERKKEAVLPPDLSSPDPAAPAAVKGEYSNAGSFTEVSMFDGYGGFREGLTESVYPSSGKTEKAPVLIPEQGHYPVIVMNEGSTMVGSLPGAVDAVIRAPEISRIHARIRRKEEKISIADLHSKNGTFVNGAPLSGEERSLYTGDTVRFADINYTVGAL